jgi:hypothetical protein
LTTPLFQNNETILNLIYTYNAAPWSITPYFQYTHVPAASSIGAFTDAATYGGAIRVEAVEWQRTVAKRRRQPPRFRMSNA